MNNIDVVISGISFNEIDVIIKSELNIDNKSVVHSHFFTEKKGDFEYDDKMNLADYFSSGERTCNIYLNRLQLYEIFNNVVLVISSDRKGIDLTINFQEGEIWNKPLTPMFDYLSMIYSKYYLKTIYVGDENSSHEESYLLIDKQGIKLNKGLLSNNI